jgi:hypothetical protein
MTEREREFLRWMRAFMAEIDRVAGPDGDAVRHQAQRLFDAIVDHLDPGTASWRAKRASAAEKAREPAP